MAEKALIVLVNQSNSSICSAMQCVLYCTLFVCQSLCNKGHCLLLSTQVYGVVSCSVTIALGCLHEVLCTPDIQVRMQVNTDTERDLTTSC